MIQYPISSMQMLFMQQKTPVYKNISRAGCLCGP